MGIRITIKFEHMKSLTVILAIILCVNLNAQKGKFFNSKWRSNPTEDLKLSSSDYQSYNKGKFLYYLSNDNENIYVDIKITESLEQNKVLDMGITVWLDMEGKTRKKLGIRFPIGAKYSSPAKNTNNTGNLTLDPDSPLAKANTIELTGFQDAERKRIPSNNADNIRASIKYDNDGNLIYHLLIPLSKLSMRNDSSGKGAMPFTMCIEYGSPLVVARPGGTSQSAGIPSASGRSGGGKGGSGGGGGRGGNMSGGRPGGGGSGFGGGPQPTVRPSLIWIKNIMLSSKE